jgi:hypothetical protein
MKEQERAEQIFEFVLQSVERKCGLSSMALMSGYQAKEIVEVRRMLCKMLRSTFGLTYVAIGKLLEKNHATVMFHVAKHDHFYVLEKKYARFYDELLMDVSNSIRTMNYRSFVNGTLRLKEIHSSEHEVFEVIMACFTGVTEAKEFLENNSIKRDMVVYYGPTKSMPSTMAHELVFNDEKKYMEELMMKSRDLYRTIMGTPITRYYLDYTTGLCTIKDDPIESYMSAASMLGNMSITVVYTRRQTTAEALQ